MATGYTWPVREGTVTFEEFVLSCAKAFAWWMRDSDSKTLTDPPIQDTYAKFLRQEKADLARLEALSAEEIMTEHEEAYWKVREDNRRMTSADIELKHRYLAMLEKVEEWEPPSEVHEGLKKFMIEQLNDSITHDCDSTFQYKINPRPFEWHEERITQARKMVDSYAEKAAEEAQRNIDNQKWTDQLRESLGVGN